MEINSNTIVVRDESPWFSSDYYCSRRTPVVEFELIDTEELNKFADAVRVKMGRLPLFNPNESGECDLDGWYEFSIRINGFTNSHVDSSIDFTVWNGQDEDETHYVVYCIDLTEEEQREIYDVLNVYCKDLWGMDCEELLEASRKEMEDEYEG